MSGPTELLLLRLSLIAIMFGFLAVVALTMRGGGSRRTSRTPGAGQPRTPAWKLVVVSPAESGLARGTAFPLAGTMVIGRDSGAGIVIPDASVSLRHASIARTSGGWRISDLGSTNGTLVNSRPVDQQGVLLRGEERIAVGAVVLQILGG